jgi:hypothetical protein
MTLAADAPRAVVQQMLGGSMATTLLYIAAELRLPDLLQSGPQSASRLAAMTGANPNALQRVLRAMVVLGLLRSDADGFALTPLGGMLGAMRTNARLMGHPVIQQAWSGLHHTVMTGQPAFDHVFGKDMAAYFVERPSIAELFNDFMGGITAEVAPLVVEAYDFGGVNAIVDVGGGDGSLLRPIVAANPHVRGIVLDLAHVRAQAIRAIAADGLADRCRFVTGDFFEDDLPPADAYLLKSVLHDWDDARCVAILEACRRAMPADGRVLVIEGIVADDPETVNPDVVMSDLTMLAMDTGRERTLDEHRALLEQAGLCIYATFTTAGGTTIVDARVAA